MAKYKLSERIPGDIWELANRAFHVPSELQSLPESNLSHEQLVHELRQRFQKVPYPYVSTRAQARKLQSTHQKLEKLGLLDAVFESRVIRELKYWSIDNFDFAAKMNQLHSTTNSVGRQFHDFHVSMAKELVRHTEAVRNLKEAYSFGEEWIGPYLRTAEERLLREASLIRFYLERNAESDSAVLSKSIEIVHTILTEALQKKGVKNDSLSRHLTSIVLSSNSSKTGHLSPNPEAVRQSLRRSLSKKKRRLDKTTQ